MDKKMIAELEEIIDDYKLMPSFVTEYNNITAIEFDYYAVNKLSLFVVHENYDFARAKAIIEKMDYTMPSIKRIFVKPIIHLKDEPEIQPVEVVKKINNETINHIAGHCELWDDVNENGIKPLKLLTRTYKDDYSIYENIVFVKTVNAMLSYLRKNKRQLENLMYTSKNLEFNLLERVNHLDYFLAIGKLHTGYIRNFSKYYDESIDLYKNMDYMYDSLNARLKRNVYRLNKNYKGKFTLHKTNILHMQKDYRRVYNLLKYFNDIKIDEIEIDKKSLQAFYKNYCSYLKIITIFAIMHFNFEASEKEIINYDALDISFSYSKWNLKLKLAKDKMALELTLKKDKEYKIIIAPSFCKNKEYADYDEIVYVTPFIENEVDEYVNISDIESFRRIQRIIYRAMIYSDVSFDTCAYCGHKLKNIARSNERPIYLCSVCHSVIKEEYCDEEDEVFYSTGIDKFQVTQEEVRDVSLKMHYRNITDITKQGVVICPCCNGIHTQRKEN